MTLSITVRNVNEALLRGIMLLENQWHTRRIAPRDPTKTTLEATEPVATLYQQPRERVLFCPVRDANPFFHFFEALWILSGRNDVKWLRFFLERMAEYSDNGLTFHGAYGYRMTIAGQAEAVVAELTRDRSSRRAVIALWQPELDAGYTGKDMPCNTTLYFKVREDKLNMTVCCRSNDMVWGAYGANAVQFSTIQEYIAARVLADVGWYVQWSDSYHVYTEEPAWKRVRDHYAVRRHVLDPYNEAEVASDYGFFEERCVRPYRMVRKADTFDRELDRFMLATESYIYSEGKGGITLYDDTSNPYFSEVAIPLFNAFCAYRVKDWDTALKWALMAGAEDWSLACAMWLHRRKTAALIKEAEFNA